MAFEEFSTGRSLTAYRLKQYDYGVGTYGVCFAPIVPTSYKMQAGRRCKVKWSARIFLGENLEARKVQMFH